MKIIPKLIKIKDLIEWLVKDKTIKLPTFQRNFVWKDAQIKALSESIKDCSPIGMIIFYRKGDNHLLIDGQQRVTSIKKINDDVEKYGITDLEKFHDYKLVATYWEKTSEDKKSLAKWFRDANKTRTPLDLEDIHLTFLSQEKMVTPSWFNTEDWIKTEKMYEFKNSTIDFDRSRPSQNDIYITELLYYFAIKIDIAVNHDYYLFARIVRSNTEQCKIKKILVWAKRVITLLYANDIKYTNPEIHEQYFDKKIKEWLHNIFNKEELFKLIAKKINYIFQNFQDKFKFANFPTSNSSTERKLLTDLGFREYMLIYMLDFIKTNRESITDENIDLERFKQIFDKYKIRTIDVINFATQEPISVGEIKKWFNILFKKREKLFYDKKIISTDTLMENILVKSKSNKLIKKITELTLHYLFEKKLIYTVNDGSKIYYKFDHFLPQVRTKSLNECSSLSNISLIERKANEEKSSAVIEHWTKEDMINIVAKENNDGSYEKIIQLVHKFDKNKKISQEDFDEYSNLRSKIIKDKLLMTIEKDA